MRDGGRLEGFLEHPALRIRQRGIGEVHRGQCQLRLVALGRLQNPELVGELPIR